MIEAHWVLGPLVCAGVAIVLVTRRYKHARSWIAGVTAAAIAGWAVLLVEPLEAPGFFLLASAWGVATAVDIAEHRLPDLLTVVPLPAFLLLQLPWVVVTHEYGRVATLLAGSLTTGLVLLVLALIKPSGFGLGDVKLGLATGAALGWFGLGSALTGLSLAFLTFAAVSIVLLITRRIARDSEMAFGPFMILGVIVAPAILELLG